MAEKHHIEADERGSKRAKTEVSNGEIKGNSSSHNVQEHAVGIAAFVSPEIPGFQCVLKHRYTDFLVNEILPDGRVLHLESLPDTRRGAYNNTRTSKLNGVTDASATDGDATEGLVEKESEATVPTPVKAEAVSEDHPAEEADVPELSPEDRATLHDIFGEATTNSIAKLYGAVLRSPNKKPRDHPTIKSEVISEKSKRTEAHAAVRRIFNSKLQTETLQDQPGVIAIKATPSRQPQGARGQDFDANGAANKGKLGWDELGGEYLHFTLHKENKDTMEVLYFIASQLKIRIQHFEFAGTKDRRAVTVQKVAVFRVHANKIASLLKNARGWVASDFEYKKHGLQLGDSLGNEFLLTLRDVHFDGEAGLSDADRLAHASDNISKAVKSFKTKGFINYYGLQRFGTHSTGTHAVGLKMLQGKLEGAIDCILAYDDAMLPENQAATNGSTNVPQDDISRADVIRSWRKTGRLTDEQLYTLPRRFQAETAIMKYLSRRDKKTGGLAQDKDWQGALMQLQRNLRLMYVHAYQSLVWNTAAGKRWEMFGGQVVEGDLVIIGEKEGTRGARSREEVDEDGEPIVRPAAEDSAPSADELFERARALTKEDIESGKYDIFDIVLPQPGFDVLYPANPIGKFYEEFMASDAGGGLNPHDMRRAWKDVSLSGAYRKVMARPGKDCTFDVREYEQDAEQMVETDLERLRKAAAAVEQSSAMDTDGDRPSEVGADVSGEVSNASQKTEQQKKIALVMKFQLGSSQYATMALRELTKGGATAYKPEFSTVR